MRKVIMEWPDFNVKIPFILEDEVNKDLCDEFWNNLPLVSIQEHGSVSGKLIYCWVNMLSFAKVNLQQLHSESPVGRVSYSQGTGNKVIVKYGELNEDCYAPCLGLVPEEYFPALEKIGVAMWSNYFNDKKCYKVNFTRGD